MTQVNFYHLTQAPLEKALPRLMEKIFKSGAHVVMRAKDEVEVQRWNQQLWTYTTIFFLPHGTKKEGFESQQPIYITQLDENPNKATVLVLLPDAPCPDINAFEKCVYMFDGTNEAALKTARTLWSAMKKEGHTITYWQQHKGSWESKEAQSA